MKRILMLAALPQEYAPLLKSWGPWRRFSRKPFPAFVRRLGEWELLLVETGMGQPRVQEVLRRLSQFPAPDYLLTFGFVGALSKSFPVGRVVLGDAFLPYSPSEDSHQKDPVRFSSHSELLDFCKKHEVEITRVITTERPLPKKGLIPLFSDMPTVLDMESVIAARHAVSNNLPFLCICAVSDAADQEIDFDLDAITDSKGVVNLWKVLLAVLRQPGLIRIFYENWRRSSLAARNMGKVLAALLALQVAPGDDLPDPGRLWCTGVMERSG